MKDNVYHFNPEKYKKKDSNKKYRKYLLYLVLLFIIIFIIFYLFFRSPEMVEVKYGEVTDGFETSALLIREEEIITSPASGEVTVLHEEGKRLHHGSEVIKINKDGREILLYNHSSGLISYNVDGLEYLTANEVNKFTPEKFNELERDFRQIESGHWVEKGQPVFRLVDNYSIYAMIKTSPREASRYREGEIIFVRAGYLEEDMTEGRIIDIQNFSQSALITMKLDRFIDAWLSSRWANIEFIKNIHSGLIVPREAVFNRPEGRGVLVVDSQGEFSFERVKIIRETSDGMVVEGLEIGDMVIVNPEDVNFGQEG